MISIWMVQVFDAPLCKPLKLIFKSRLESAKSPLEWENANVPADLKGGKIHTFS